MTEEETIHVMVTGANSGVGFGLLQRFLDHYVKHTDALPRIILILACRNAQRAQQAIDQLYLRYASLFSGSHLTLECRVRLEFLQVDLSDTQSVQEACREYKRRFNRLDLLYMNAGILLIEGIDWWNGPQHLLTDPASFFTDVSSTLKQSVHALNPKNNLGKVFSANVLGHYIMLRQLQDILASYHGSAIWTGSQTSDPGMFNWDDPQCLYGTHPYESSKVLTEMLTCELNREYQLSGKALKVYVADPGVVSSNIVSGTVSWLLSTFVIVPVLAVVRLFSYLKSYVSLFYLSGLEGTEAIPIRTREQSPLSSVPSTLKKYSSASNMWKEDTAFVVLRDFDSSIMNASSVISYLDSVRKCTENDLEWLDFFGFDTVPALANVLGVSESVIRAFSC